MTATAKLFAHGGSQAVRLPKAFRFEGSEVSIRKEGDAVILEPIRPQESWDAFFARIDALNAADPFPAPGLTGGKTSAKAAAPVEFDR
jgi:antitoxin VapB